MMSFALMAETGLMVAWGACLATLFAAFWTADRGPPAVAAAALGFAAGGALSIALLPWLDDRFGRGTLLSTTYVGVAAAPLLVANFVAAFEAPFLAVACALLALSVCATPQRVAIAYDLCPSRTRLRSSLDFQAVRLASGSVGVAAVALTAGTFEHLGLWLASAYAVMGLAVFATTLGSLGRRRA
jgi:hypothetical protein